MNFLKFVIMFISLSFVLFVNGAVPFVALPTLGQAVWTSSFAQSFANQSIFSIYAVNFGLPESAPIAFGLSGAWVTSAFISFGAHPADAYSLMVALWCSVAFFSAFKISRILKLEYLLSVLMALLWMTFPVVWAHSGYSMVSLGIALLPFYFLTFINLFRISNRRISKIKSFLLFVASSSLAVFMDGYSFVMFGVGSAIMLLSLFVKLPSMRGLLKRWIVPVYIFSFVFAYLIYVTYIGQTHFSKAPIGFFRSYGADLSFFLIPSKGLHWFFDILNLSVARSSRMFFGDGSVWVTTFSLPLLILGIWSWIKLKATNKFSLGIGIVALFSFYMSLGPSLKINSTKSPTGSYSHLMSDELTIIPTGSSLLSRNLPGFSSMRASYRWTALGFFALWVLIVLNFSTLRKGLLFSNLAQVFLLFLMFVPHLNSNWIQYKKNRKMFFDIENSLVNDLKPRLRKYEKVAFLPFSNDFLAGYVSSRLEIRTYNIGGDKNLEIARKNWPEYMSQFGMNKIDDKFTNRLIKVLLSGEADVVVFPFIDLLWAAHQWPYPLTLTKEFFSIRESLIKSNLVTIEKREFYALIRLKDEGISGSIHFKSH